MKPQLPGPRLRDPSKETPLNGIRIIDFSHFIAGPFATQILADCGADVVKIESAAEGDNFRAYPPHVGGEGVPYLWTNRNKQSVALDLKNPKGRETALALIDSADVLVENFSTGVMDRLQLDYATCTRRNPKLIYCSISSYGRSGPFASRVGFDSVVQAESGFISMNGPPEEEPGYRAGPSIMDIATAMMASNAIMAALLARNRTGRGQLVEVTLIETAVNMLGNFGAAYLATGESPKRFGNAQPTASPVGAFDTEDGALYLTCASNRIFQKLARDVFQDEAMANDPRYQDSAGRRNAQEDLIADIAGRLKVGKRDVWLARMHAAGVAAGAIRTVGEAMDAPEIKALGLISQVPHPTLGTVPNIGLPIHLTDTPLADPVAAPLLGADNEHVLKRLLGWSELHIEEAARSGAFGSAAKLIA